MKSTLIRNSFALIIFSVLSTIVLYIYVYNYEIEDAIVEMGPNTKSKSLIVTAYMNLGEGSKHSEEDYRKWISTFMNVETPMVIYTDDIKYIAQFRVNKPTTFVRTSLITLKKQVGWNNDFLWWQRYNDPEIKRHPHYDLYVVWDAKTRFVYEASEKYNRWNSEYFFWVDIGSFRGQNTSLRNWPDSNRIDEVFQGQNKTVYFAISFPLLEMATYNISKGPFVWDFVQAGFFGGNKIAVERLNVKYYELRKYFQKEGFFVGKEQNIMGALLLLEPNDFWLVSSIWIACMDPWFYFQQYFAGPTEADPNCVKSRIHPWDMEPFLRRVNVTYLMEKQAASNKT